MSKKIILIDLDGTLSVVSKEYLIFIKTLPKNWEAFETHIIEDPPIEPVLYIARLLCTQEDTIILIVTARPERCRDSSSDWLVKHGICYNQMYMREDNDTRDDGIVKYEILQKIRKNWGEPFMVIDDRHGVVKMYQKEKVFTLDVGQGIIY